MRKQRDIIETREAIRDKLEEGTYKIEKISGTR